MIREVTRSTTDERGGKGDHTEAILGLDIAGGRQLKPYVEYGGAKEEPGRLVATLR